MSIPKDSRIAIIGAGPAGPAPMMAIRESFGMDIILPCRCSGE